MWSPCRKGAPVHPVNGSPRVWDEGADAPPSHTGRVYFMTFVHTWS